MSEQDKPPTVDLAPTWPQAMEVYMAVLEAGTETGKREARAELRRLAAGQVDAQVFAFLRGLRHWDGFIWENHHDWRRAVVAVSEAFDMTEEEAAAAVERFKEKTK